MKKKIGLLFVMLLFFASGCATLTNQPSVCDDQTEPSLFCEVAGQMGINLADVGNFLIVANEVAIAEEEWSTDDVLVVLKDIRSCLDQPVSYSFIRNKAIKAAGKHRKLFTLAMPFVTQFNRTQIMYNKDRQILSDWLDAQISLNGG